MGGGGAPVGAVQACRYVRMKAVGSLPVWLGRAFGRFVN